MSVVGLDVGNENCIVGVARQRGIDVVLNDESKRETPAMVSFGEKQRFLGIAGAATATMNPKNTVSQVKRLIGRKFQDPEVQRDLLLFPFAVTEGADGGPLIHVQYMGESKAFTPTQILGMILSNLKTIAEKNLGTSVVDCVIGIPVYFTELQRRAYIDAASIAGMRPLRLMHETTATALAYGIYKTDLSDTDPINVVFVDIGHASMQVCVAAFKKGQLKILGHSFDRCCGGRDFDEVLFNYFADKFKEEYKINVTTNARASIRLRAACEKMKKVLSANPEAPLNIECLMDEKDVRGFIKRDQFEALAAPILERVKGPCEKALAESKLSLDKISAVEVVGSGSRIPAILKILSSVFGKEPSRTLNASECIARGCALQCAMLSPTFRVRDFEVQDSFPFPIALSWKGPAPESDGGEEASPNSIVFVKGNPIPSTKMLTFYRSGTFSIDVLYVDTSELPPLTTPKISTFTIGPFTPSKGEKAKLKVKIRLNLHGIVSVESATVIEEEEVEVPVTKSVTKESKEVPTSEAHQDGEGKDVKMDDVEANGPGTENDLPSAEEKPGLDSSKVEVVKKKKTKRTDVPVNEVVAGGLPHAELQKAVEKEYEMALQDRVMEETKEKKNAVEAYVYDMRNKLYDKLQEYVTEHEREELSAKLQQTEDWLYEDGEDETKSVYVAKLGELKKLGDPLEQRQKEEELRGPAIQELNYCINSFREAAQSKDAKYDHINAADKEKVVIECNKAEEWFKDKQQQQNTLPKSANPVLLSSDIKKKTEFLDRFCKPIMTKARPPPPKPTSTAEASPGEAKDVPTGHTGTAGEVPTPEPMETDNTSSTHVD
jgi:heat shock protein 4